MRISTPLLYDQAVSAMGTQQSQLLKLQQQIASGRRLLSASDDPIAAAQALVVRQSQAENDRYTGNIGAARDLLGQSDSVLATITGVLQNARTTAINGGSGALSPSDRNDLANAVAGELDQLVALANSRDSNGNFLYAGFQNTTVPFSGGGMTPVVFNGDQGVQTMQVSATRFINVTQNGTALFQAIRNGNGTFSVSPAAANGGTGIVDATSVPNPSAITGDAYQLQFHVAGGSTTYDVVDVTTSAVVSAGNAYVPDGSIDVAGMRVSIGGAPADGDQFTLAPSTAQSVFTTLQKLVSVLRSPTTTATQRASFTNGLNDAIGNLDQAIQHVLTGRADIGASLQELDALASGNSDRSTQYQQTVSRLEDLDYNRALSLFSQQQVALEAAQKSFLKTSGLSLFSLL